MGIFRVFLLDPQLLFYFLITDIPRPQWCNLWEPAKQYKAIGEPHREGIPIKAAQDLGKFYRIVLSLLSSIYLLSTKRNLINVHI